MKRFLTLFLVLALLLTLTACDFSSEPPANATETAEATEAPETTAAGEGSAYITNIDDFLAAIQPGAEILLGEGEFSLHLASGYGTSKSPYYTWTSLGLGEWGLTLEGVTNLTIRGRGQEKTHLLTDSRFANVLTLADCDNITLEGLSLGHTVQTEACEGGVIRLEHTTNVTMKDLDLYGCGATGIDAVSCTGMQVQDCTIHHCSYMGAMLNYCQDVTVENTAFRDLGGDMPIPYVMSMVCDTDVTISNCVISDNYVYTLLHVLSPAGSFVVQDNQIRNNRLADSMFSFHDDPITMEGNTFEENQFRNWYAYGSTRAVNPSGEEILFDASLTSEIPVEITPGVPAPVSTGEQKEVHVSTADEFLKALNSDTCIILDTELLDLSTASEFSAARKATMDAPDTYPGASSSYYWENFNDGPSLVISGLRNLTIRSEDSDRTTHVISATPRYAYVLTFEDCSAVTISGFTAGHTKEPGYCTGGVVYFRNSEDLLVDNCGLFGCGTVGVEADFCRNLQVVNSEIYECSYCGISLENSENVAISGTLIRDIGSEYTMDASHYIFFQSKNITLDGEPIDGNYSGR